MISSPSDRFTGDEAVDIGIYLREANKGLKPEDVVIVVTPSSVARRLIKMEGVAKGPNFATYFINGNDEDGGWELASKEKRAVVLVVDPAVRFLKPRGMRIRHGLQTSNHPMGLHLQCTLA
jgi:hypothetical protein